MKINNLSWSGLLLSVSVLPMSLFVLSFFSAWQNALLATFFALAGIAYWNIRVYGLVNILPNCIKNILFKRSIYDILCDLYFLKRISTVLKAVLAPLLLQTHPAEAHQHFELLDQSLRNAIFTKGIANIAPSVANYLLPIDEDQKDRFKSQMKLKGETSSKKWDKLGWFYNRQIQKTREMVLSMQHKQKLVSNPTYDRIIELNRFKFLDFFANCKETHIYRYLLISLFLLLISKKLSLSSVRQLFRKFSLASGMSLLAVCAFLLAVKQFKRRKLQKLRQSLLE